MNADLQQPPPPHQERRSAFPVFYLAPLTFIALTSILAIVDLDELGLLLLGAVLCLSGFAVVFLVRTWGPRSRELTLFDLCVLGGGLYFGLGTLVSLKGYWTSGLWPLDYERSSVLEALLLSAAGLGAVHLLGIWRRRRWPRDWPERRARTILELPAARLLMLLLPPVWIGRLFLIVFLGYGLPGLRPEFWAGVTPGSVIASGLTTALGPGVTSLLALELLRGKAVWLHRVLISLEVVWLFFQGRRMMVISLALVAYVMLCVGWRPRKKHAILALATAFLMFFTVWPLFFHMRAIGQRNEIGYEKVPMVSLITEVAPEAWRRMGGEAEQSWYYSEGLVQRALSISFFIELVEARSTNRNMPFMGGRMIYRSILMSVPHVLWPQKLDVLGATAPEEPIIEHFRLTETDKGSTWLAFGYADGGLLGILVYGVLMVLIADLLEWLIRTRFQALTPGIFLGYCAMGVYMMQVESPFSTYVGTLRDILVLMALSPLLMLLVRERTA